MLWDLYPGAREVFLVRDFRDMMASIIAANRKWAGPPRFGRAVAASDEEHVRRFRRFVADIMGSWRRRRDRAHLVRYEDLIRQPRETVAALAAYLEVDGSAATLDRMVDSLARRDEESDVYRTAGTAEASIGRWREDLDARRAGRLRGRVRARPGAVRLPIALRGHRRRALGRETASSAAFRPKGPHATVDTSIVRFRLGACLLREVDARSGPKQPPNRRKSTCCGSSASAPRTRRVLP